MGTTSGDSLRSSASFHDNAGISDCHYCSYTRHTPGEHGAYRTHFCDARWAEGCATTGRQPRDCLRTDTPPRSQRMRFRAKQSSRRHPDDGVIGI